jgi:hypothetical protein
MSVRLTFTALAALGLGWSGGPAWAGDEAAAPAGPVVAPPPVTLQHLGPPAREPRHVIHPATPLLDAQGAPVLTSGKPVSFMRSCAGCHDTAFIAAHNYHAQAGLDELRPPGQAESGRPWDSGPGLFGRWEPLTYRVLTPPGAAALDLGTAEWIQRLGARHVGGGPAERSRIDGQLLDARGPRGAWDPDSHVLDPATGEPRAWDWQASGTVELDCMLCHAAAPDNAARIQALQQGRFAWASTATLLGTGLVERDGQGFRYLAAAFEADGSVRAERLGLGRARSSGCRQCHGRACRCNDPVVFENSLLNWSAETGGAIFSPARARLSGMNLAGKEGLDTPWDVHAERLLECSDCHHAPNNPAFDLKLPEPGRPPAHLAFDARRTSLEDYLTRPDHELVKGHTSQGTAARRLDGSMRDCRDCHDALAVHDFLPFKRTHFERLACEACHLPRLLAPARMATDWTLLGPDHQPRVSHRGVEGPVNDPASLVTGFEPMLLPHRTQAGTLQLAPHNLTSAWFWVQGEPAAPVRLLDLERALFPPAGYPPAITAALDADVDGQLSGAELRLDTPAKVAAVAARLEAVGVRSPRIQAELQPYTLGHGVPSARWALRDCAACHAPDGRLSRSYALADHAPGGVLPRLVGDARVELAGVITADADGRVIYQAAVRPGGAYVHGAQGLSWLDVLGLLLVGGTCLGVLAHGGLRLLVQRRRGRAGR